MEMDKFNADWWSLKWFKEQRELGNLNLEPEYQRSRVWSDEQRYGLIDSIVQGFPIGLVMLNVIEVAEDDIPVKKYDVVDGQQRIRTILEFVGATEPWAKVAHGGVIPFAKLKAAAQQNTLAYKVPVALMTKFDDDEINEIFRRLQEGKALKAGEKLKAYTTSKIYSAVQQVASHRIFEVGDKRLMTRNSHWMLAAAIFQINLDRRTVWADRVPKPAAVHERNRV